MSDGGDSNPNGPAGPATGLSRAAQPQAWPLALALAATLTYGSLADGGFSSGSQAVLVALAGLTVLVALFGPEPPTTAWLERLLRSPFVLCLLALAALSAISALWSIGSTGAALRHGALIAAYAAIAIAAARLASRFGPWPLALAIAALAVVEAAIGLQAMLTHTLPDAEAIYRHWRPGGSYEYPPALAVLEVSALPVVVFAAGRGGWVWQVLGAFAAVLLGLMVGASGTRLEPVLGLLAMFGAVTLTARGPRRRIAIAVTALALLAAAFSFWIWRPGAIATHHAHPATAARSTSTSASGTPRATAARVAVARSASAKHSDLLHGRRHAWQAALDTWQARPLLGFGAGTYYTASRSRQGANVSLYPHNLALEQAVELGAVGFLLVLGLYLTSGQLLWRSRAAPVTLALLGPIVTIFLISNLFDWTWHLAGLTVIWAAATGTLLSATTEPHTPSR